MNDYERAWGVRASECVYRNRRAPTTGVGNGYTVDAVVGGGVKKHFAFPHTSLAAMADTAPDAAHADSHADGYDLWDGWWPINAPVLVAGAKCTKKSFLVLKIAELLVRASQGEHVSWPDGSTISHPHLHSGRTQVLWLSHHYDLNLLAYRGTKLGMGSRIIPVNLSSKNCLSRTMRYIELHSQQLVCIIMDDVDWIAPVWNQKIKLLRPYMDCAAQYRVPLMVTTYTTKGGEYPDVTHVSGGPSFTKLMPIIWI